MSHVSHAPKLEFVDDSMLQYYSLDDLYRYACRYHDAYYELYKMCNSRDPNRVHILNFCLYMPNYVNYINSQYHYTLNTVTFFFVDNM